MTLFLSDTHLGNKQCKSIKLLQFLKTQLNLHDKLFLVGDIIDDHQLKIWPDSHKECLQLLFQFKEIIYIPGNHDSWMRKFNSFKFQNIIVCDEYIFKDYLITHGDNYDWMMKYAFLSSRHLGHWSSMFFGKLHTYLQGPSSHYVKSVIKIAKKKGVKGVICGHNHNPEIRMIDGIEYINCGDWYNSFTAVVEEDRNFEIITI